MTTIKPTHRNQNLAEQLADNTNMHTTDARHIIDRITHLSTSGESPLSIMRRLNPPALSDLTITSLHTDDDTPSRSTAAAFQTRTITPTTRLTRNTPHIDTLHREVANAITNLGGSATIKQIASHLGMKHGSVNRRLDTMYQRNQVTRRSHVLNTINHAGIEYHWQNKP